MANKYQELVDNLKKAREAAVEAANKNPWDGGSFNFDSMLLFLGRGWTERGVTEAAEAAGLSCHKSHRGTKTCYVFSEPIVSFCARRTIQAEAMNRVMQNSGYKSYVWYYLD